MINQSLTPDRWHTFPLAVQLGNTASEVGRCITKFKAGDKEYFNAALTRMLDLLDRTIIDPKLTSPRRRELLRAREQICTAFFDNKADKKNLQSLENYFMQFALIARK